MTDARPLAAAAAPARQPWIHPVPPWLPAALFGPLAVGALAWAIAEAPRRWPLSAALAAAGLLLWTLAEYGLHRGLFHRTPASGPGRRLHWLVHGYHHAHPGDGDRVVVAPWASLPLAALVYAGLTAALGDAGRPLFAGFLLGYVAYDSLHHAIHHRALGAAGLGRWLKAHHLRHHFRDGTSRFGVTTPLWDWVFRTLP